LDEAAQAGGFFTLANTSALPDRLVAASSPVASQVEIYAIKVVGGEVAMRPLEGGLALPSETTLTLQPRGYHLLLRGLTAPLAKGRRMPVTLSFEKAGSIDIELVVEDEGPVGESLLDNP
jgi:periplasmic copper chaperone A